MRDSTRFLQARLSRFMNAVSIQPQRLHRRNSSRAPCRNPGSDQGDETQEQWNRQESGRVAALHTEEKTQLFVCARLALMGKRVI